MIINHNMNALNAHRQMASNLANAAKSQEKLSSGLRINRAGDDAAGLAISEKMRGQIRGLDQASSNSQNAISMIQTAEGALNETHSILQRMRELAVQSGNDTNVSIDRDQIQKEMNQLTSEINRIGNTTEFNTMKLLDGTKKNNVSLASVSLSIGGSTIAGGTAADIAGTGAAVTALTTSALSDGSHTLIIQKTIDARLSTNQSVVSADTVNEGALSNTFGISNSKTLSFTTTLTDAMKISFTKTANDMWKVTVSYSGTAAGINSSVDYVSVGGNYDNHGLKFTIDANDSASVGSTISKTTTSAGTLDGGLSTTQTGWTTGPTCTSTVSISNGVVISVGANYGDYTIKISGTKATVTLTNADGTMVSDTYAVTASTGGTIKFQGISFDVSSNSAITSEGVIKFTIDDKYTIKASTDGLSNAQTIATGVSVGTTFNNDTSIAGLRISGAVTAKAISTATTIESDKQMTGTDGTISFQIGANQNQGMMLELSDMRSVGLGLSSTAGGTNSLGATFSTTMDVSNGTNNTGAEKSLDVSTATKAGAAITTIDAAIQSVSGERSKLGAYQNRLEHTINNLNTSSENLQSAESRIRDVDMAKEMMSFSKNNILQQAAQAMLAQANQQPQGVLQLLR